MCVNSSGFLLDFTRELQQDIILFSAHVCKCVYSTCVSIGPHTCVASLCAEHVVNARLRCAPGPAGGHRKGGGVLAARRGSCCQRLEAP